MPGLRSNDRTARHCTDCGTVGITIEIRATDSNTAGTTCGDDDQRGLAGIRQAVQPVGLAANHLQGPLTTVWHVWTTSLLW